MNIRHIAQKAGVSVATVSRVLNHPESVATATKEKIEAIIAQEEYTPNWFARGLNFNKTATIGLMIPHIMNPMHMEIAKGVEDVAQHKDYTTFMCNVEDNVEKEKQYLENLIKRRVDGIVFISSLLGEKDLCIADEQGIPVVMIGENRETLKYPVVRVDCQNAAYEATKHLLEIGHHDIAMLYGKKPEIENRQKIEGYKTALKEAGIAVNDEFIISVENTIEGGYLGGKKYIDMEKRPQAVFATSDLLAFGVIDAMKDNDISVPKEMAVIGFDNIRMSNLIEPKLTTVEKPLHKMGVLGARLLFDMIESKEKEEKQPPKEILLQAKLKIRKSCGHKERIGEMF
ncbi:MAG: LacI family transcriptional regulator [Clostridia bacterium]|nr:LacI family transcriptional regulator [Clostridia bacterium]